MLVPCYPGEDAIARMYQQSESDTGVQLKEVIEVQDEAIRQCNDQLQSLRVWKATQKQKETSDAPTP